MLLESEVKVELAKLLDEYGDDYVYRPQDGFSVCSYANSDGSPSCIVGHLLARLEPEAYDSIRDNNYNTVAVAGLLNRSIIEPENDRVYMGLRELQYLQDNKVSWGDAVKEAFDNAYV